MARLPVPGQDNGSWGDILNNFLLVGHNPDGSLKVADAVIRKYEAPLSGIPRSDLSDDVQTSLSKADASGTNATTTNAGVVQLSGDLSGSATAPIVKSKTAVTVGVNANYNFSSFATAQEAIQAAIDASTITGAKIVINTSYTLTGSVFIKSNVDITHLPGVVCTFNSGHVNGTPTTPNSGFHAYTTNATQSNFKLYGMNFNGGLTTLTTGVDGAEYHAIYIHNGCYNFKVSDIYATRTASGAVRFRDACSAFVAENIRALEADAAIICTVGNYNFTLNKIRAEDCFAEGLFLGDGIHDFTVNDVHAVGCTRPGLSINSDDIPTSYSYRGNISNVHIEGPASPSAVSGLYLTYCNEMNFSNIYSRGNGRDGILLNTCSNVSISNAQCWNNNRLRLNDGVSQYSGIRIYDSKYIKITNAHCDDDSGTNYQYRGIDCQQSAAGGTNYISVVAGRTDNTVSSASVVVIGNNSTVVNHDGFNPDRWTDRGSVSAAPSVLLKNSATQQLTITQDTLLQTLDTNAIPGQLLTLIIAQDSVGGHIFTLPANAHTLKPFVVNTTANSKTAISFRFISSSSGWLEVSRTSQADANGAFIPADIGLLATNFDPALATNTTTSLPANGTIYVMKMRADTVLQVSAIVMAITSAGSGLTSGQNFAAIYDGSKKLLTQTSDQSIPWASSGVITMPLQTSKTIQPGYFYVVVWSNGTSRPAFARGNSAPVTNGILSSASLRFASADTSITTTPPAILGGFSAINTAFWAGVS